MYLKMFALSTLFRCLTSVALRVLSSFSQAMANLLKNTCLGSINLSFNDICNAGAEAGWVRGLKVFVPVALKWMFDCVAVFCIYLMPYTVNVILRYIKSCRKWWADSFGSHLPSGSSRSIAGHNVSNEHQFGVQRHRHRGSQGQAFAGQEGVCPLPSSYLCLFRGVSSRLFPKHCGEQRPWRASIWLTIKSAMRELRPSEFLASP